MSELDIFLLPKDKKSRRNEQLECFGSHFVDPKLRLFPCRCLIRYNLSHRLKPSPIPGLLLVLLLFPRVSHTLEQNPNDNACKNKTKGKHLNTGPTRLLVVGPVLKSTIKNCISFEIIKNMLFHRLPSHCYNILQ